jgi:Cu+-exporting ATPase
MRDEGVSISGFAEATTTAENDARTSVYVAVDGQAIALLTISDPLKPGAAAAVRELRDADIEVRLLSGDAVGAAEAVARQVGIEHVTAEVLPAGKIEEVRRLQAQGLIVAMVGDGINDAPALAQADVGIAIGTGTDVAIEASDITLIGGDPRLAATAIRLSRATLRVIHENLFWAFAYNIVLIPIAMGLLYPWFGIRLDPILAAGAMAFSSVSVVLNSLRLRRVDVAGGSGPKGQRTVTVAAPAGP